MEIQITEKEEETLVTEKEKELTERRQKICALKAKGMSLRAISAALKEDGEEHVALTTIWKDLESTEVKLFIAELARRGLAALDRLEDKPYLQFRGIMEFLKWFAPPVQRVEQRTGDFKVDARAEDLIKQYDSIFFPNRQVSNEPKTVVEPGK